MPRIRTIKPEFWDSPSTAKASPWARLLFIAMWNWADDHGRGTANLKELEGFAFPNDERFTDCSGNTVHFRELVAEVAECFGVTFYTVRGRPYYEIPTWDEHQRNERRARQSKHPSPQVNDAVAEIPCKDTETPHTSGPGTGEKGNRGKGEQVKTRSPAAPSSDRDRPPAPGYPDDFEVFWQAYPRKAGKRKALSAWRRARKRATNEELAAGAARYRDDPNREDRYTKHPETWLNGDCWTDEPLPDRNSSTVTSKVDGWLNLSGQLAELENPFTQGEITP